MDENSKKLFQFNYYWKEMPNLLVLYVYFHNITYPVSCLFFLYSFFSFRFPYVRYCCHLFRFFVHKYIISIVRGRKGVNAKRILFTQKNTWSVSRLCKFFPFLCLSVYFSISWFFSKRGPSPWFVWLNISVDIKKMLIFYLLYYAEQRLLRPPPPLFF